MRTNQGCTIHSTAPYLVADIAVYVPPNGMHDGFVDVVSQRRVLSESGGQLSNCAHGPQLHILSIQVIGDETMQLLEECHRVLE